MSVEPNNSPLPSQIGNSPFFAPFLTVPDGELMDIQAVGEGTAIVDPFAHGTMPPQGPINSLAEYRARYPYVPVQAFPNFERTVFLEQGKAKDIRLPRGLVTVQFKGSAPYFMCFKGNAELPALNDTDDTMSLYMPEGITFFVGNTSSVSVIAPNTGTVVSAWGHRFTEMPR